MLQVNIFSAVAITLALSWVALGDENEYQTAKPETENPPEDQDSSPSFHDELPEQPTLRQVLESMKPPSLTDDEYVPESGWLHGRAGADSADSAEAEDAAPAADPPPEELSGAGSTANGTEAGEIAVSADNSTAATNTTSPKLCNCLPLNRTQEELLVGMVNATGLYAELQTDETVRARAQPARCVLVLFYGLSCPFSAVAAPHFNAVPRAFPDLSCLAVEATAAENDMSLNSRFGIIAVPAVLLFHNGRPMARFNESEPTLQRLADFVQAQTLLTPAAPLNVTSADFVGPVPAVAKVTFNWYLALAWTFITACALYGGFKVRLWRRVADSVRNWWIEAEQHLHEE